MSKKKDGSMRCTAFKGQGHAVLHDARIWFLAS